ncbi:MULTISPECIES: hypothetical protein [Streptomyces]|uniref:hypothetical protein n=1 Tax=Streptomyces TaxID=1883 RepID=UPI001E28B6B0|nr:MULTISPECIES: hypothetical protein [Streptomyces]UFQ13584.1 hypothetical protein J2N69_00285 [Streptomyces huasconensis]WCL83181.1 hypothetical protein PPN52_00280 [Streptomyces sp. JCM 35825]
MTRTDDSANPAQLVLFSGGRDSTLAAASLMLQGIPVHLFHVSSGPPGSTLTAFRVEELRQRFGDLVEKFFIADVEGTFRSLAMEDLEQDILTHRKNLILLGDKLAIYVHAVDYCTRNGISVINDGIVRYQQDFPEQRNVSREFFEKFVASYGITSHSPIYEYATSQDLVKYRLMQLGLSTKSLEENLLFGDCASTPSDDVVQAYLRQKEPKARDIVDFLMGKHMSAHTHAR